MMRFYRFSAGEVEACRWRVKRELAMVEPRLTVALGATAAASLAGHNGPLHAVRGRQIATREGDPLFVRVHPSFLSRLPGEETKAGENPRFVGELREAKALAGRLVEEAPNART
jgi:DNA polymerase